MRTGMQFTPVSPPFEERPGPAARNAEPRMRKAAPEAVFRVDV